MNFLSFNSLSSNVATFTKAGMIHILMCKSIHEHLSCMSNPVQMWSKIVAQKEMHQPMHKSVPQQLNGIQFWGACGKELKKYPVVVPKVFIQPS